MKKSHLMLIATAIALIATIATATTVAVVPNYPAKCFETWSAAATCRKLLVKPEHDTAFLDRVMFIMHSRLIATLPSKTASVVTLQHLANDLQFYRSGIAEACFYGLAAETGSITSLAYAGWFEGEDAPASYGTYLTSSPVNAPVSNCPSESVFYILGTHDYGVCDAQHIALSYYYITNVQPACPF